MRFLTLVFGLVLPLLACAEGDAPKANSQAEPAAKVQKAVKAKPKSSFKEGKHYSVIKGQPKPSGTGKIKVEELFWYGCGHCYKFESVAHHWLDSKADDVKFVRTPAMWRGTRDAKDTMWLHAKLYHTAVAMGAVDKLHIVFFEAMHKKNMRLTDPAEIEKVVNEQGLDGKLFVATMDSFAVEAQVAQGESRQKSYKITGTPELVVGGYYHISSRKAGSHEKMFEVADFLVDKIRSER